MQIDEILFLLLLVFIPSCLAFAFGCWLDEQIAKWQNWRRITRSWREEQ